MNRLRHIYMRVHSDMKKEAEFNGNLADFACEKLNEYFDILGSNPRIISISDRFWQNQIRPREDCSVTWYDRSYCELSVYYESDIEA